MSSLPFTPTVPPPWGDSFPNLVPKQAFRLHPRRAPAPQPSDSQMAGLLWPAAAAWPTCATHQDRQFLSILQLNRKHARSLPWPARTTVLQVLWCPQDHRETSNGPLPKLYYWSASDMSEANYVSCNGEGDPVRCRLNLEAITEHPSSRDLEAGSFSEICEKVERKAKESSGLLGSWFQEIGRGDFLYDSLLSTAPGCKLGGYPAWVQEAASFQCPSCGSSMTLFLTFSDTEFNRGNYLRWMSPTERHWYDASDFEAVWKVRSPANLNLGDGGRLFIFTCLHCHPRETQAFFQCT